MPRTTIRSDDITDAQVKTADMAVDPTNASNLSSGSVPLAQLGNAPATDVTGLEDDIALLGFRVAANGSFAKYNLVDQTVDAFEDATGVNASASTNEIRNAAGKYYGGSASSSGGTITTHGIYTVHSFLTTGNTDFVVGLAGDVDALIVAGGGGAGQTGGGGGAGGFRTSATHAVTAQTYTIVVGGGGAGLGTPLGTAPSGSPSTFDTITSAGGGGGGCYAEPGGSGGSGGGGGARDSSSVMPGGAGNTPSTSPVQGYDGGDGFSSSTRASGGGGGASEQGPDCINSGNGGHGGDGLQNAYRTGSNVYYAGGGAGSGANNPGNPGQGGGGATCPNPPTPNCGGGDGTVNSGGGGGGGIDAAGGAGGSGIVVIRYPTGDLAAYNNMTLVSTTTAAQAAPTKGDIVFTHTNGAGSTTVDTDVTAEISADGGSTWTAMTLGSEGSTGSHNIATAHNVTITSTITSPWNMAYRIKTLNQAVGKTTRIQAVSLGWS